MGNGADKSKMWKLWSRILHGGLRNQILSEVRESDKRTKSQITVKKLHNHCKPGALRLTQHKRFVPFGTHPNFACGKTSFMLEPLGEMLKTERR